MQVGKTWKVVDSFTALLGDLPPTRVERPVPRGSNESAKTALVDARSVVDFRGTSYGGRQDPQSTRVRRVLVEYYRDMLSRINLFEDVGGTVKTESTDSIKKEEGEETSDATPIGMLDRSRATLFRGFGILTETSSPVTLDGQTVVPWEFYVIPDRDDESQYMAALTAMTKDVPDHFAFLNSWSAQEKQNQTKNNNTHPEPDMTDDKDNQNADSSSQRLSLYPTKLTQYTGVFPGMAVGVVGEALQRNTYGILTGVLVHQLVLPTKPCLPWYVDRPLPTGAARKKKPLRVQFCSGPFPRKDLSAIREAVVTQAFQRGADVLIIGGPLISPFETEIDKTILAHTRMTFLEQLDTFVSELEKQMEDYYALRPKASHLKVILLPNTKDVTQVPVLPCTMYSFADTDDILFRSNPCRLSINGVHFGICNEDVVASMQDNMIEKWPTAQGSLRRSVEALVQSRLYTPLFEFPSPTVDLNHLSQLFITCLPKLSSQDGEEAGEEETPHSKENWDYIFDRGVLEDDDRPAVKRLKYERGVVIKSEQGDDALVGTESMPHVLFLPSTRPSFATVTHRSTRKNGTLVEESLMDPDAATGVLVVNQEIYSKRAGAKFVLRVAEVTIPDCQLAACRGAIPANGVSCGVLKIESSIEN